MKESGAKIIVRALEEGGVEFSFGIPGTHNIELYDVLIDSQKIQTILVTDEQCASFMADGVARASGRLACVNVVPGAGLTHALSGIAEASLDQIPMLVLGCGIRQDTGAAYQLHHVDQAAIVRPVCKRVYQPQTHGEAFTAIREACVLAGLPPAGPVFVEIPVNLYLFPCEAFERGASIEEIRKRLTFPSELLTEPKKLAAIAEALNASEKIALYVGLGAQGKLIELAERLDAIVFTTISGKGLFPEDHPRWGWNTIGRAAPKPIRQLFDGCDCLLAIGCRFGEVATGSYGVTPPEKLIHIDIDPSVFQKNFKAPFTLQADAREAIQALLASDLKKRETNQERLALLTRAHAEIHGIQQTAMSKTEVKHVSPHALFAALQAEFGPDAIYVTDSGNGTFLAMEQLRLQRPHSFLGPIDYSCMGYSVPAAVGAKLAAPERPVIALAGDGAFLMTGLELLTAASYEVGVIVCILNDGKLSQIAQFQKASLNRETCTTLPSLDWEAMAASLGISYLKIDSDENIRAVAMEAHQVARAGRPVLIDIAIDYSEPTFFSKGVVQTNFLRFPWKDRIRLVGRFLRRKVFFVSLFCLAFSSTAQAKKFELLDGKILLGGQIRVRYEYFDNTDFTIARDRRDFVLTRLRPDFEYHPHEQVILFFQPQFTGGWGEGGASLTGVNAGSVAPTSGALDDPTLGVHQGYFSYSPSDWFTLKLGRQELAYGDLLVIGNVDWNNVGRSFDALKMKFSFEKGWLDAIWSLLSDAESGQARGVATGPLGDAHLFGLYSSWNFGDFFQAVDLYTLYRFDDTASPRPHNYVTTGLRLKAKPSAWDYRFEGTGQFGELAGADQRDYQVDLEGGYTFADAYHFRIGLEAFLASLNYNQLFPTTHQWLGFLDLFGRRNIFGGILHLSARPAEKWTLALDAHTLFRTKTSAGLFRLNGVTAIGAAGTSTSRFGGEEIDLTVTYQALDLLGFQTGFSVFIPTGFVKTNVGSRVPVFGYLQTNVTF